jgi:hypothetical protein
MKRIAVVSLGAMLAACPGPGGASRGDTATFRVFYPDAPAGGFQAKVGKRFQIKPVAQCVYDNGRDGKWSMTGARVDAGKLPPGLALEDGAIGGLPTEAGEWALTIRFAGASCAGKSHDAPAVDVKIVVAGAGRR